LALRTEGIVVDITYGARALAVVRDLARRATGPIVLWHTGGWLDAVADLGLGRDRP
jgi:1-aminocyclopropane-1-carboxylate deaminase/D-cysteine desulfhydrase-like pyridoxal-dependent ACC family enzyme